MAFVETRIDSSGNGFDREKDGKVTRGELREDSGGDDIVLVVNKNCVQNVRKMGIT